MPAPNDVAELVERALEVGPLTVELVDEHHARDAERGAPAPHDLGLHLDALDGAHDEDGQVGDAQRRLDVADEVGVAGRVDEVDLVAGPLDRQRAASEIEIRRFCSSGSKSDAVVPSSTRPIRLMAPDRASSASARVVLPLPPWPTRTTLRILSVV